MPPASPKSSMSLGELAICQDFLDGHREYAIDLLSNLEKIRQWHRTDSCPETRKGRSCTLCELCSADGLMGATKKALASYDDDEKRLKTVRASLGKSVPTRGAPGGETLFKNSLAKAVFLSIVTVGDTLRSQHAAWQARLQSEVATSSSFTQSLQYTNTDPGNLDKNRNGDVLLPTYSGPRIVGPEINPKLTAVSTGPVPETTSSSSMFVVVRRCLSSDCPCEANRASAASNTNLTGACGSQVASKVPLSLTDSKKTRTSKVIAKSEATTRGGGNRATRSTTQKPSTYHNLNIPDARASDAPRPGDAVLEEHASSSPTSETALWTRETESCSSSPGCGAFIVDPGVFRLRTQIARADDTRRALMEWCQACRADLQLDPRERHGIGPEASLTHESAMRRTHGYPSALAYSLGTVEPGKSPCMTGQVGEVTTKGLSHGNDETTAQELRFNEQEELKGRWLRARQKRCKDRKRRPSRLDLH